MRRLLGPSGGAVRQNVLAASDMAVNPNDDDCAAWAAHRKTEKREAKSDRDGGAKKGSGEANAGRSDPQWY